MSGSGGQDHLPLSAEQNRGLIISNLDTHTRQVAKVSVK